MTAAVQNAFGSVFGSAPDGVWAAPGRVNLIGEHTDYNDGFVLPFAVAARVLCAASARSDDLVEARSVQLPDQPLPAQLPRPGAVTGWGAYVAGTVWALRAAGHPVGGLRLLVDGQVPLGAGLASSAALCCAVALASTALSGLRVPPIELALAARRAEHEFVGAPVGLMDQLAVLYGRAGHAVFLDTRTLAVEQVPLRLREAGLALLVIDTRAPHRLADGGGYAARRRECEQAARQLGVPALRDATDTAVATLDDPVSRRRATHVMTENARVLRAVRLLRSGADPRGLGPLLTASHGSLREDFEVSVPELDLAVAVAVEAGAHGARLTGGGFGGSVIVLVEAAAVSAVAGAVAAAFAARGFTAPAWFVAEPSAGATRLV